VLDHGRLKCRLPQLLLQHRMIQRGLGAFDRVADRSAKGSRRRRDPLRRQGQSLDRDRWLCFDGLDEPRQSCFVVATSTSRYTDPAPLCAEAVAQTITGLNFLYVCDKVTILG
jgi:hypothetical protein